MAMLCCLATRSRVVPPPVCYPPNSDGADRFVEIDAKVDVVLSRLALLTPDDSHTAHRPRSLRDLTAPPVFLLYEDNCDDDDALFAPLPARAEHCEGEVPPRLHPLPHDADRDGALDSIHDAAKADTLNIKNT